MKKKPSPNKKILQKDGKKYIYIFMFVLSALLLVSPLVLGFNFGFFRSLGLVGITLINFFSSATLFLPTPGFLAIGLGGKLYNPLLVAFLSALGSSLGEIVGFTFGYSTKKISTSQQNMLDKIEKLFKHKYAPIFIILLSFIPNPFFDAIGIVAGISLYPLRKFLIYVFIGRFLRDLIIAYAGQAWL